MECAVTSDLNRYEVEQDRKEREFDRLEAEFNKRVGGNLNQHIREHVQCAIGKLLADHEKTVFENGFMIDAISELPWQMREEIDSMIQFDQDFLSSIDGENYLSILRGDAFVMMNYFHEMYEPEHPEFWMKLFLSE